MSLENTGMVKQKSRYKQGDKVIFEFLGEKLTGVIESIQEVEGLTSSRELYLMNDGRYKYPLPETSIRSKIE